MGGNLGDVMKESAMLALNISIRMPGNRSGSTKVCLKIGMSISGCLRGRFRKMVRVRYHDGHHWCRLYAARKVRSNLWLRPARDYVGVVKFFPVGGIMKKILDKQNVPESRNHPLPRE